MFVEHLDEIRTLSFSCIPSLCPPPTTHLTPPIHHHHHHHFILPPAGLMSHLGVKKQRKQKTWESVRSIIGLRILPYFFFLKPSWWKTEDHWYEGALAFGCPLFIINGNQGSHFSFQMNFCSGSSDYKRGGCPHRDEHLSVHLVDLEPTDLLVPALYTCRWQASHLAWCALLCAIHDACPLDRDFRKLFGYLGRSLCLI